MSLEPSPEEQFRAWLDARANQTFFLPPPPRWRRRFADLVMLLAAIGAIAIPAAILMLLRDR